MRDASDPSQFSFFWKFHSVFMLYIVLEDPTQSDACASAQE